MIWAHPNKHIPPQYLGRETSSRDVIRAIAVMMQFGTKTVLNGVDLAIRGGEIFVILGPSGCGKTTLLRHISGMLQPTMGSVLVEGKDIYDMPIKELNELRRRMGFSFQHGALLNSMTVHENLALPLQEATDLPQGTIDQICRMKLDMVGLLDVADAKPSELSGGMKKRAAIARAVALDPDLVFFDEPTAGLDPITAAEIDNLILKLNKVFGITMVVVTHDIASAFTIADHMIMLLDGVQLAKGSPVEVRANMDRRVQDFLNRALPSGEERKMDISKYMPTNVPELPCP